LPIAPTEAEIQTQLKNVVKIYDELKDFAEVNATDNWLALEDIITQSLEGEFAPAVIGAVKASRASIATALNAAPALEPILREYGRFINSPHAIDGSVDDVISDVYRRFVDTSATVNSRELTYGTVVASGTNTGNGTILRLTVDENNRRLEACHLEAKIARISRDANTGSDQHEEEFTVNGSDAGVDALELAGSGIVRGLKCVSARNSLINNASFSQATGTATASGIAVPTAITDWTVTSAIGNLQIVSSAAAGGSSNTYRGFPGEVNAFSLMFKTTETISQDIDVAGRELDPATPYMLQIAYNRDAANTSIATSGVGTLVIRMGTQTATATLSTASGWNLLRVSGGQGSWYKNFKEDDLDIEISATLTTGQVIVDDILFVPYELIDGTYYRAVGARTRFLREDTFKWTDSQPGTEAKINYWLFRSFGRYLPSATGGGETVTDPT
jgi:hypothetical protein